MKTTFDDDVCNTKGALVRAHGKKKCTPYMTLGFGASILVASSELDVGVWHRRLGHMNKKGIKVMLSKDKLPGLKTINLDFCENCAYGKQRKISFSKARRTQMVERLELVHANVWGKASIFSLGCSLYFVTFIDDSSRMIWIYFLKHKLDVFDVFKKWLAQVENESGRKLKCLKSDNGGEYCNSRFKELCASRKIRRVKTISRNPHQNRVAERMKHVSVPGACDTHWIT